MLKKQPFRFIGLAAAAGLAFSLSACGGTTQTTAEACEILETDMETLDANMETAIAGLDQGDMSGLVGAFDSAVEQLDSTAKKIDNEEVKSATVDFQTVLKEFNTALADSGLTELVFNDIDPNDTTSLEKLEEFETIFVDATAKVDSSSAGIEELCGA